MLTPFGVESRREQFFDICDNNVDPHRENSFMMCISRHFPLFLALDGWQVKIGRHRREMKLYLDKENNRAGKEGTIRDTRSHQLCVASLSELIVWRQASLERVNLLARLHWDTYKRNHLGHTIGIPYETCVTRSARHLSPLNRTITMIMMQHIHFRVGIN